MGTTIRPPATGAAPSPYQGPQTQPALPPMRPQTPAPMPGAAAAPQGMAMPSAQPGYSAPVRPMMNAGQGQMQMQGSAQRLAQVLARMR